ncbi:hypothetical protein A2767_02725 [Candidatus Roizmanbacteria bacterium RIFCSPHIGHO2_01_FULL_35_10]|uniref:MPN domain-containing protein n=1 Tax=Candidatus Roizmanbacteria bacterium RIFCSPLOWO2_01_FULL_35_13 TaxID=1802055 RepID=A0A1F7IF23_9BACT|nr:MAG: hypothetical protein A2767_02725 [Candidatus Roizmanbacteria bacterium RIFCSPHIGHO2_01_FULL_35_10]OGK41959.1 MAG: hypothetical protein A3A74_04650 [Candidatus Roizmanbacteria bacterium RIFCSPLOWO2_01_FULL_35_13]
MKIKDISKVDRPREKLIKYGANKLNNAELLAIILGKGVKGKNVIEVARSLLRKFPEEKFAEIQLTDLKNFKGIGITKACQIIAFIELGKRILKGKKSRFIVLPKEIWEEMKDVRSGKKEYCYIFYLDVRNQIVRKELISVGTLNASLIHPREVFEPAVRISAAQIILSHNHPSGDSSPSDEDIKLTERLIEAGEILGIEVIDHVIVSEKGFTSMKEKALM